MNDLDPRIGFALDRLSPESDPVPEWGEVLSAARTGGHPRSSRALAGKTRPRRRLRPALVLASAAVVLGILLATPAFGLRQKIEGLFENAVPASPSSEEMSVFSRPRTEADVLPKRLSYRLGMFSECTTRELDRYGACFGKGLGDASRLLLSELGAKETSLYAWPTETGAVCWAWDEGAGSCVLDWTDLEEQRGFGAAFMGIDPDEHGAGAPQALVGIVPDDVVSAEVVVLGESHPALVESNGLIYELPSTTCTSWAFEAITVTYRDGTSDTRPIEWHHGPRTLSGGCEG